MIILPTRRRLERRRDKLYAELNLIINSAPINEIENITRKIHVITLRLRTYFKPEREPEEYFNDNEDDINTQDTTQSEVCPTTEELAQIEAKIKAGEI